MSVRANTARPGASACARGGCGFRGSLGRGRRNRPDDVSRAAAALKSLGLYEPGPGRTAPWRVPDALDTAIRRFQRRHKFKPNGVIEPGGPTARALVRAAPQTFAPGSALEARGDPEADPALIARCRQLAVDIGNMQLNVDSINRNIEELRQDHARISARLDPLTDEIKIELLLLGLGAVFPLLRALRLLEYLIGFAHELPAIVSLYGKVSEAQDLWKELTKLLERQEWALNELEKRRHKLMALVRKRDRLGCLRLVN
jgi:hypothetical protein